MFSADIYVEEARSALAYADELPADQIRQLQSFIESVAGEALETTVKLSTDATPVTGEVSNA